MREAVVMRNPCRLEKLRHDSRERAGAREEDADPFALRVVQEFCRQRDNRLGLLRRIASDEEMNRLDRMRGAGRDFGFRFRQPAQILQQRNRTALRFIDRLGRAECFFPRANPGLIKIARFVARIIQDHRRLRRSSHGGTEQRPERPVRAIESSHEQTVEER